MAISLIPEENRSPRRKTSRSRNENQQQTEHTYDVKSGNRNRAKLVGGECSHHFSPLRQHRRNKAIKEWKLEEENKKEKKSATKLT